MTYPRHVSLLLSFLLVVFITGFTPGPATAHRSHGW
jgi:threonine/homoserine/homoserine lactone efflux protein